MYRCKCYRIEELVDRFTFEKYGQGAWAFFNVLALQSLDQIRIEFDAPVYVNNWLWGGSAEMRGLRPRYMDSLPSVYSQHHFGNAFDITIKGVNPQIAQIYILENPDKFPYITRLEKIKTHVHFDCANIERVAGEILHFTP